ncbi:MAG TPA: M48 family metalloprotease [Alphaproteobacteria bacterium]|jgi:hypothetical protein
MTTPSPRRIAALAFALSLLGGCESTGLEAYSGPIESAEAGRGGEAPAAVGDGPYPYRFEDLAPSHRPDPKSDEAGLWLVMDKVERTVRTAGNRIRDERLNAYVQSVACRVTGPHCGDIRVYLMQVPAFNASMAPNGMMHIWSGLLLRVQNEAQLAAVIGHEAGHYLRRHSLQRLRDIIDSTNTLVFLQIGVAAAGVGYVGDTLTLMTLGQISAFSRDNEREADGYGLLLLSRAGYDPGEAWKVWDRLERETKARKDRRERDLFTATHPAPAERLDALKTLAKRVDDGKPKDLGRRRFLDAILPHRAGFLRDELHLRQYDSLEVLLDILIKDGANPAELHFFKGELHRLRGKDGDLEKSLKSFAAAKAAPGEAPPEIDRSMGLVHRKLGNDAEARAAFERYLRNHPDAPDKEMIRHLLRPKEAPEAS